MVQAEKLTLCKLRLHTDVVFYVKGRHGRVYTRHEPWIWDGALCHKCNNELAQTKKVRKRVAAVDAEVAKIKKEIEHYGHPLLTGITS